MNDKRSWFPNEALFCPYYTSSFHIVISCSFLFVQNALLVEPVIQVIRQGKDCQLWCVESLANRLVDMRDLYNQHKEAMSRQDDVFGSKYESVSRIHPCFERHQLPFVN